MKYPPRLKRGDTVAVVSPSGIIDQLYIDNAVRLLGEAGYNVKVGAHANGQYHFFSGTVDQRLSDLNAAIKDESVKAIFCARGGYGAIQLIEGVHWSEFVENPKWLIGFSDVTVLHAKLNGLGLATIHGPMPKTFPLAKSDDGGSLQQLLELLQGKNNAISIDDNALNVAGNANGQLIGGNLSIIYSLLATPFCFDTTDKILFIEDLCEQNYHLDRMMNSLKYSGFLSKLSGVMVGQFTDMKDSSPSFGSDAYAIIYHYLKPLNIPVCFNLPVGHTTKNYPLILGADVTLNVSGQTTLTYNNGKTQHTWRSR